MSLVVWMDAERGKNWDQRVDDMAFGADLMEDPTRIWVATIALGI